MRKRRRRRRYRRGRVTLLILFLLLGFGALVYMQFKPKVVKAVTIEAGDTEIDILEFILNKNDSASFVTDITSLDLSKVGSYPINIKIKDKIYTSLIEVIEDRKSVV